MTRLALLIALALAAGLSAASAPAASTVRIVEANGPAFPVRTYVLTLPNTTALSVSNVQATENGNPVAGLTIVPASQANKKTFGVVLVVDASDSMKGVPIEKAVAAENAFVAQRNPNQQLGLIAFNDNPTVVLPLTTSQIQIEKALAAPPQVAFGTHIYDAVAKAEAMLAAGNVNSGSIVVLSDGADTGSSVTGAQVAAAAQKGHIRIDTIGLRSGAFNPRTLQSLAKDGGGDYTTAKSTSDLAPLFNQLGQLLSNQYLVQYKSLAGPNTSVHVRLQVPGVGTAATAYQTPALPVVPIPAAYHPSLSSRIWGSTVTMAVLALLGAAVIALLVIAILQPRRSELPSRMSEFVSVPGLQQDQKTQDSTAQAAAGETSRWARFGEMLEIAEINTSPATIIVLTIIGTLLVFLFIFAATGSVWWALFALLVPVAVREWIVRTLARRRNRFAEQLPDALQVIASALRSGHSFAGALAVVVESASEPMKKEMQRVVADEQRGIPLQASLGVVAERMQSRDVEQIALVAELQREAGGNAAEVIDRVAETVRERFELRRLVQTLTVQGRMSRWIVTALPIAIILILRIDDPHYLHPLLASTTGKIVFGLAAALMVGGSLVIKRIVDIEV